MNKLIKAFKLESGRALLSLVGGGGKTTTMFTLAKILASSGKSVLITTTTAIILPHPDQYDCLEINEASKPDFGAPWSIAVIGNSVNFQGKMMGMRPEWVDKIYMEQKFDCILVEADGSKQKPIKAPDDHEPVIPSLTTHLVGIIGLDAVGKPATEETVHRMERFCHITMLMPKQTIDALAVSRLILSDKGLFKGAPGTASKYLVLNKAENADDFCKARAVTRRVQPQGYGGLRCLSASMQNGNIWTDLFSEVTGVIMASGFSRRMNSQKLLLELNGMPIIEYVIRESLKSRLKEVLVVYREDSIKAIAANYPVKLIHNPDAVIGQSESLKLGVLNSHKSAKGVMFMVGDQPFMTYRVIDGMIEKFEADPQKIVITSYQGERGNPVLFPCRLKGALHLITGDKGGKEIIKHNEDLVAEYFIEDKKAGFDVDTWEDYEKAKKTAQGQES